MKNKTNFCTHLFLILILFSCSSRSEDNNPINGGNTPEELSADFDVSPICCPPVTATGRYFDYVEMIFTNHSTGEGLEYEWSFGSTEANPTEIFSLYNGYNQNTLTFGLTVTDTHGNTAYAEKSIELPMLVPFGTFTFDGVTCDIDYFDYNPNLSIYGNAPTYSSNYDVASDGYNSYRLEFLAPTLDYNDCGFPLNLNSLVIRIGGSVPTQTVSMTQTGDFNLSSPDKFYVSFANNGWKTFDSGTGSSGAVTIAGMDEGYHMIVALDLNGQVKNVATGETKAFNIDLNWIPHSCYYNYSSFSCDDQPGW